MSIDTKGMVVTDNKDIALVCARVEKALLPLVRESLAGRKGYASIDFCLRPSLSMVVASFKYANESRLMYIHFDCDCDASEYGGPAIILSLGFWGSSEKLMRTALCALQDLGATYIDVNDCDDEGYMRLASKG